MTLVEALNNAQCLCQWGHNPGWMGCDKAVADRAKEIFKSASSLYDASQSYEAIKTKTITAARNPQVGDRYHEMYSYWSYVIRVDADFVYTLSAAAPCEFPTDGKLQKWTKERFVSSYSQLMLSDNFKQMIEDEKWFETALLKSVDVLETLK